MLQETYRTQVLPRLVEEFKLDNLMAAPRVTKVIVNMGIGDVKDNKEREKAIEEFASIVGQRPSLRPARKSIAGFGIRKGDPVGLSATLRGKRMYAFLEKLTGVVLPRLRDFRGVSRKSFDGRGNYTLGIAENAVFPEIDLGRVSKVRGLEVTIVTSTRDQKMSERLLEELGMPFEKDGTQS